MRIRSPQWREIRQQGRLGARSDTADMNSNKGVKQMLIGCGLWKGKPDLDKNERNSSHYCNDFLWRKQYGELLSMCNIMVSFFFF